MKFKVISDLHVDINAHLIPEMKFDTEAFYLIAGDISGDRHITTKFLRDKNIKGVFVEGNHLGYNVQTGDKEDTKQKSNEYLHWQFDYSEPMVFLENDHIFVGGINGEEVCIIGCTLYTDFDLFHNAPIAQEVARQGLNDFRYVKVLDEDGTIRHVTPSDYVIWFNNSLNYINEICEENKDTDVIVLTHFAPSLKGISVEYTTDKLTPAYASELDNFILEHPNIKYWCNGHVHHKTTYKIGETQVICNPFGYYNENNMDLTQPLGYDIEV